MGQIFSWCLCSKLCINYEGKGSITQLHSTLPPVGIGEVWSLLLRLVHQIQRHSGKMFIYKEH